MIDKTLGELATLHGTDKGPLSHNYTPHYERHLAPLRDQRITLVEIGVQTGASLRMWADWFSDVAVIGLDNDPACQVRTDDIVTITTDVKRWDPSPWGDFDIVVDDGSHAAVDIIAAHDLLWPKIAPGGWYIVEDLDVQADDSPVLKLVDIAIRRLAHEMGEVSEVHVYPQILFLRRAA